MICLYVNITFLKLFESFFRWVVGAQKNTQLIMFPPSSIMQKKVFILLRARTGTKSERWWKEKIGFCHLSSPSHSRVWHVRVASCRGNKEEDIVPWPTFWNEWERIKTSFNEQHHQIARRDWDRMEKRGLQWTLTWGFMGLRLLT